MPFASETRWYLDEASCARKEMRNAQPYWLIAIERSAWLPRLYRLRGVIGAVAASSLILSIILMRLGDASAPEGPNDTSQPLMLSADELSGMRTEAPANFDMLQDEAEKPAMVMEPAQTSSVTMVSQAVPPSEWSITRNAFRILSVGQGRAGAGKSGTGNGQTGAGQTYDPYAGAAPARLGQNSAGDQTGNGPMLDERAWAAFLKSFRANKSFERAGAAIIVNVSAAGIVSAADIENSEGDNRWAAMVAHVIIGQRLFVAGSPGKYRLTAEL